MTFTKSSECNWVRKMEVRVLVTFHYDFTIQSEHFLPCFLLWLGFGAWPLLFCKAVHSRHHGCCQVPIRDPSCIHLAKSSLTSGHLENPSVGHSTPYSCWLKLHGLWGTQAPWWSLAKHNLLEQRCLGLTWAPLARKSSWWTKSKYYLPLIHLGSLA